MTTTVEAGKKNNNRRIWIGLGIAALFCLCAVGVAAFIFWRLGQQFAQGFETDPVAAAEAAHKIADYELPPGYQEEIAMDFFVYSMVMITPGSPSTSAGEPVIMLAQFPVGTDQQQMQEQIRRSFEQQSGRRGLTMELIETKEMTIRGADVEVFIYEGSDESGSIMRQLITTFPGKGGTAMLMIMGTPQAWDQEEIDTFIESIQ